MRHRQWFSLCVQGYSDRMLNGHKKKHTHMHLSTHSDISHTPWQDVWMLKMKLNILSSHFFHCLCLTAEDDGVNPALFLLCYWVWFLCFFCSTDGTKSPQYMSHCESKLGLSVSFFFVFVFMLYPRNNNLIDEPLLLSMENAPKHSWNCF